MTQEALKLALEALEKALRYHSVMLLSDPPQDAWKYHCVEQTAHEAITAIKEALVQTEQEPVHNVQSNGRHSPLLTHMMNKQATPPQRTKRHELQAKGEHPAPCARHCEATAFRIVIKNLESKLAQPEQDTVQRLSALVRAQQITIEKLEQSLAQTQEPVSSDPLPRACNLAGVDYQTFLKIKAYMPVTPPQRTEQEPLIGCVNHDCDKCKAQRSESSGKPSAWVGLTEDERDHLAGLHLYAMKRQVEAWIEGVDDFAQAIEAKLKEKNT